MIIGAQQVLRHTQFTPAQAAETARLAREMGAGIISFAEYHFGLLGIFEAAQ